MMRVLVTGSAGFVGRNLVESLCNIRDGKDMRPQYAGFLPLVVDTFDVDDAPEALAERAATADAVVHLAGVNRPEDPADFVRGNRDLTQVLVDALETSGNQCPVVLASSVQATLEGRYAGSDYGRSKREAENVLHEHSRRTGAEALIYRLPNVYGKWCRPNYNSVVATFCYNTARGLPLRVDDPSTSLELIYIDDLVSCILDALLGKARRTEDGFCQAGPTDHVTLGQIVDLLRSFSETQGTCALMDVTPGTFPTAFSTRAWQAAQLIPVTIY
jgi:UDP-2-acetamido-2,6-beta-L-arabino-hexul-4-ose reductase